MKKLILLCIVIIIIAISFLYPVHVLQILDGSKGTTVLYETKTNIYDKFTVKWIHSVSKQPVLETYEIQEDLSIKIHEMIFNENGPNLPAGPEQGTKWEIKNGEFRVYNYSLSFDEVPVRIGQVIADHTLIYNDIVLPLKDVSRPGGFVRIKVIKTSFAKYLFGGINI